MDRTGEPTTPFRMAAFLTAGLPVAAFPIAAVQIAEAQIAAAQFRVQPIAACKQAQRWVCCC